MFSLRSLLKAPGLCVVVILSLGLAIGANSTVLCWLQHLHQDSLPGVRDQRSMAVLIGQPGERNTALPNLRDITGPSEVFEGAAATQHGPVLVRDNEESEWGYAQVVTANYFDLLGVRPLLGRTFLPSEDTHPGGDAVVVLNESYWESHFNRRPDILGRTIEINRHAFTIIGVTPREFCGTITGLRFPLWVPVSMCHEILNTDGRNTENRYAQMWHNVVRLRPGVSLAQAQAFVDARDAQLALAHPDSNRQVTHRIAPLSQCPWGAQQILLPVMHLLFAMTLLVWLLASANVTNLLLARSVQRRPELAVRIATGATRGRLVRLLLSESLLLALAAGVLGMLLSSWMIELLRLFLPATDLPTDGLAFRLNLWTIGATVLLTLGTGFVIGVLPALRGSKPDLASDMKEGGRNGSPGADHARLRKLLVVAEISLAVLLLISASLCLESFQRARVQTIGMKPDGVLIADLHLGMQGYTQATAMPFYVQLRDKLARLPGVEQASLTSWFPLGFNGCKGLDVRPEGYLPKAGERTDYDVLRITPGYFSAMGTELVAGRDFLDSDDLRAPRVAIVNEAFAEHFWPGQNPLGRTFRSGGEVRTVVGVAKQGRYNRMNESPRIVFYLPAWQGVPDLDLGLCLRVSGDPLGQIAGIRNVLQELDPKVDLRHPMRYRDYTMAALFADRTAAGMLGLLAGVALALAAMGIYAVMSYGVNQRLREFGIRMALGADEGKVLKLVLGQALLLAGIGTATGLLLSALAARGLARFLVGINPYDPVVYGGVALGLAVVAALACVQPALRAVRAAPAESLRRD